MMMAPARAAASPPGTEIEIRIEGLRSARGMVRLCLTRDSRHYLDCEQDPAAYRLSAAATRDMTLHFSGVAPGGYALLVLHDENGNGRIDKFLGIPKEGVGFSRNPKLVMGPPAFDKIRIEIDGSLVRQTVQIRYFL